MELNSDNQDFYQNDSGFDFRKVKPENVNVSSSKLEQIDNVVESFIEEDKLAGAITVVVRHGKIIQFKSYGNMSIENNKHMTDDAIFRIYSMTKPITNLAAMILREEGKFRLDDLVSKYIPKFEYVNIKTNTGFIKNKNPMTIKDLMMHTSGITYHSHSDDEIDSDSLIDMLIKTPLQFEPNTSWCYGYSTDVLGILIEIWSGLSLEQFFKKRIFQPLKMIDTGFTISEKSIDRLVTVYKKNSKSQLVQSGSEFTSPYLKKPDYYSGGGGLLSTASDYMKFLMLVQNGGTLNGVRLLSNTSIDMMITNQLSEKQIPIVVGDIIREGIGFGFGFSVRVSKSETDKSSKIGEYGWGGLAGTCFWASPKEDLIFLILQQTFPYPSSIELPIKKVIYDAIIEKRK